MKYSQVASNVNFGTCFVAYTIFSEIGMRPKCDTSNCFSTGRLVTLTSTQAYNDPCEINEKRALKFRVEKRAKTALPLRNTCEANFFDIRDVGFFRWPTVGQLSKGTHVEPRHELSKPLTELFITCKMFLVIYSARVRRPAVGRRSSLCSERSGTHFYTICFEEIYGGRKRESALTSIADESHLHQGWIFVVLFQNCVVRYCQVLQRKNETVTDRSLACIL